VFHKGDKVVYPHHGAAVIEDLVERELQGETRQYFKLKLAHGDLTLMVPVDNTEEVGLRGVVSKREVKKVIEVLREEESKMPTNWSRRFKTNVEKIKSGDIYQVAEVVRNLSIREKDKGLSAGEKRMLSKSPSPSTSPRTRPRPCSTRSSRKPTSLSSLKHGGSRPDYLK
jgi:CarD family transcriptional regulator